jgi:hypothetical protein
MFYSIVNSRSEDNCMRVDKRSVRDLVGAAFVLSTIKLSFLDN